MRQYLISNARIGILKNKGYENYEEKSFRTTVWICMHGTRFKNTGCQILKFREPDFKIPGAKFKDSQNQI